MNSTDGDRFDGPEGVDFPRFSRRIGILNQSTRPSAAIGRSGIGVLRSFSGVLQPEPPTDGRPLPDLSYLTLRPVANRIIERERSVSAEETQPDLEPTRGALEDRSSSTDPNAVAGGLREPSPTTTAGSPTDAEVTVREALRESDGSNSSDTGPTVSDDQRGARDIRTLESDFLTQLRRTMSSQRADNRTRSADSPGSVVTADRNRSTAPDQSSDAPDVSARSARSSWATLSEDDLTVRQQSGPPLVESADTDRDASQTGDRSRSDRSDTSTPAPGAPPEDERASRRVHRSERGERVSSSQSSPGKGPYPTLRLREDDGSIDRANGPADADDVTDTRHQDPRGDSDTAGQPSVSRDRGSVSLPSDLSLDDEDASRFVDALYRELERKARIERNRRGM
jgi:hypothetical protein